MPTLTPTNRPSLWRPQFSHNSKNRKYDCIHINDFLKFVGLEWTLQIFVWFIRFVGVKVGVFVGVRVGVATFLRQSIALMKQTCAAQTCAAYKAESKFEIQILYLWIFRNIHVHINDFLRFVDGLWALRWAWQTFGSIDRYCWEQYISVEI